MKVKVCGLNNPSNINELTDIGVDLFGFIFYKKSARYLNKAIAMKIRSSAKSRIEKVGVFVDANEREMMDTIAECQLNYVQLHGKEVPGLCEKIRPFAKVIKVFSIDECLNTLAMEPYINVCDYFLFDTKTNVYGGSGKKFNWQILEDYKLNMPFFLSGGISGQDVDGIKNIKNKQLYGVDINSKFESVPGLKDVERVSEFIKKLKM